MATKTWSSSRFTKGVVISTVVLEAGDVSNDLDIPNYPDKTVHLASGTFGDSTVSILGSNNVSATFQPLHRTDDPTKNYSGLTALILGHILENPSYIRASATGATGTGLSITITASTPRG